jgi:hypothetical protein
MSPRVSITVSRDVALMTIGWIQAKRPEDAWDPMFLTTFMEALEEAVNK